MATPSSSVTSPSPPMTYFQHPTAQPQSASSISANLLEKEQRQRAIQKFMARAEISTITRSLRTRLSYASYKAIHNVHHVSLRDLEAQTQTQPQIVPFPRSIAAKRKAPGYSNHYTSATQGPPGVTAGSSSQRRGASSGMPPPSATSSPRAYHPAVNGGAYATFNTNDQGSHSRTTSSGQNLYTSILALPPAKQSRTLHSSGDLPGSKSSRSQASPRARVNKSGSRTTAEVTRKSKKPDHSPSSNSPSLRKAKRTSNNKGKQKQQQSAMEVDVDVDMKAAAALTSLLLHHRPSIAGSASSPRSSIDGSETGSVISQSLLAQSSATRGDTAASPPGLLSATASTSTMHEPSFRSQTPPPSVVEPDMATTPRPAPTDSEAANLMLYLATSPSPARPANKDSAAYRTLGGGQPGALRDKGRVLFASGSNSDPSGSPRAQAFSRDGDASFTSSISSIGSQPRAGSVPDVEPNSLPSPIQLLPPPSLPSQKSSTESPPEDSNRMDVDDISRQAYSQGDFNFSDFIHGSPSPARGPVVQTQKANLGLRADVGRKLFEEEQMRHAVSIAQTPGKSQEERALEAGFDLAQS